MGPSDLGCPWPFCPGSGSAGQARGISRGPAPRPRYELSWALLRHTWGRVAGVAPSRAGHSSSVWGRMGVPAQYPMPWPRLPSPGTAEELLGQLHPPSLHRVGTCQTVTSQDQCQRLGSEPLAGCCLEVKVRCLGPAPGRTVGTSDKNSEPNCTTWQEGRCGTCCTGETAGLELA